MRRSLARPGDNWLDKDSASVLSAWELYGALGHRLRISWPAGLLTQ
jgi:hypothetical protein